MKKTKGIACIALSAVLGAGLCGCGRSGNGADNEAKSGFSAGDASISDKVENIRIDWTDGEVIFTHHDGKTVDISEEMPENADEGSRMCWRMEGTTLYIKYKDPAFTLVDLGGEKRLTVDLPEDLVLEELEVDSAAADIRGQDIKAGKIMADVTSGDMDLGCEAGKLELISTSGEIKTGCTAGDILITSTSGGVELVQKGEANNVSICVTSGDINADMEKFSILDIAGTSSEVKLALPEDSGFTAKIETTGGEFTSGIPVKMDGDSYIAGDGASKINVSVTSGDVNILAK